MSRWFTPRASARDPRLSLASRPSRLREASIAFESSLVAERPALSALSPDTPPSVLVSLVKADLAYRFGRGERPGAAEYLERFPGLKGASDQVVSLVYEEYCLLEEYGEAPDVSQFCLRYGPWKDSLQSQLGYHHALTRFSLGPPPAPVAYPKPGERFKGFTLREILGQGGAARVFLAEEDEVGGRKVALKVSANKGQEPSILGKLDHANIVPVHSVVVHEESGLRGLCMPYRPGMTLDQVIRRLGPNTLPDAARSLTDALMPDGHREAPPDGDGERPGWADFPLGGSYPDAVAWIALALANALSHAHKKGILHRDVKPANILLTFRDGPQLLDFNLAHDPNAATEAEAALRGGTLPYMAPEQLQAFLDPERWSQVGASADLYALGLVLRELLTGHAPETPNSRLPLPRAICDMLDRRARPATPIRALNPRVRPSLASIIDKCLSFDPSMRHATADQLAEDLRRYLARRPLAHAPNTSAREQAGNAIRRNARRIAAASLVGPLGVGLALAALPRDPAPSGGPAPVVVAPSPAPAAPAAPEFPGLALYKAAWDAFWKDGAAAARDRLSDLDRDPSLQPDSVAWTTLVRALIAREEGFADQANGLFYAAAGQPEAVEALTAWTRKDADDSLAWYYLAVAYSRNSLDVKAALEYYKKAAALNPGNKPAARGVISCMQSLRMSLADQLPYVERWLRIDEYQRRGVTRRAAPKEEAVVLYLTRARANAEACEALADRRDERGAREELGASIEKLESDLKMIGQHLKDRDLFFQLDYGRLLTLKDFLRAQLLADEGRFQEADRLTREGVERANTLLQMAGPMLDPASPDAKLARLARRIADWRAERKMKPVAMPDPGGEALTLNGD